MTGNKELASKLFWEVRSCQRVSSSLQTSLSVILKPLAYPELLCLLKRTELFPSLTEEEERGTGSCECGSGITRVVMTRPALCSPALLGPSIKQLSVHRPAWPWRDRPFVLQIPGDDSQNRLSTSVFMFLGIFLTRAVSVLRQSSFSSTSLQHQLAAWHPCIAGFIVLFSLSAFSSDARCWGSITTTVDHSPPCLYPQPSVRPSPWRDHIHPVEISAIFDLGEVRCRKRRRGTCVLWLSSSTSGNLM